MRRRSMRGHCEHRDCAIADPVSEATRLAEVAVDNDIPMRMMGGVAVAMRCPSASQPPLRRDYHDLDLVAPSRKGRAMREVMETAGYEQDQAFNALHGGHRLYFWDPANERNVDVFLDKVEMSTRSTSASASRFRAARFRLRICCC